MLQSRRSMLWCVAVLLVAVMHVHGAAPLTRSSWSPSSLSSSSSLTSHSKRSRPASLRAQALGYQPSFASALDTPSVASSFIAATPSVVNVMDFGAKGDASVDDTAAFQRALAAVATSGGIVFAPTGRYRFDGVLTVPRAVTLEGTFRAVPSHNVDQSGPPPVDGTTFLPYASRGQPSAAPFILLKQNSVLRGVVIFYPETLPTVVPVAYPYTIQMTENNAAVIDCELLNSFNGIYAVGAHRHYIARVQGQPTNVGIFVDATYDIGRIEDVHWNPWFSVDKTYLSWQLLNGRAFVIARTDWEYVLNTFAFGYAIGYHFVASKDGECNGNFVGIGADMAVNASILVEAADEWGIEITNGEFTAFMDPNFGSSNVRSTEVVVAASNKGPVRFVNSAFWGPSANIAYLAGGTTTFGDCTFTAWGGMKRNTTEYAIVTAGGDLIVHHSLFQMNANQIQLLPGTGKAVINGNIFAGADRVTDMGAKNLQKGLNAFG